jgi:hypothetical protein
MATTVKRTITTALWDYTTPEGARAIAYRGDVVELDKDEAERGAKAGVFDQPGAGFVSVPVMPEPVLADNFEGVYDALAAEVPGRSPGLSVADEIAPLRHDVQAPVEAVPAAPMSDAPKRPLKTAPVADWRVYVAEAHGVSEVEAAELTKAELIELYGG